MSPVTYKPNSSCEGGMEVHRYGRYVSVKEYNKLKAEVERLRKAGDSIISILCQHVPDSNLRNLALREWQSAKEGKQP